MDDDLLALGLGDFDDPVAFQRIVDQMSQPDADDSVPDDMLTEGTAEKTAEENNNADPLARSKSDVLNAAIGQGIGGAGTPDETVFDRLGTAVVGTGIGMAENAAPVAVTVNVGQALETARGAFESEFGYDDAPGRAGGGNILRALEQATTHLPEVQQVQEGGTDHLLMNAVSMTNGLEVDSLNTVDKIDITEKVRQLDETAAADQAHVDPQGVNEAVDRAVRDDTLEAAQELRSVLHRAADAERQLHDEAGVAPSSDLVRAVMEDEAEVAEATGLSRQAMMGLSRFERNAEITTEFGAQSELVLAGALDNSDVLSATEFGEMQRYLDPGGSNALIAPLSTQALQDEIALSEGVFPKDMTPDEMDALTEWTLSNTGHGDLTAGAVDGVGEQNRSELDLERVLREHHGVGLEALMCDELGNRMISAAPHVYETGDDLNCPKWEFNAYVLRADVLARAAGAQNVPGAEQGVTFFSGSIRGVDGELRSFVSPVRFGDVNDCGPAFQYLDNCALADPSLGPDAAGRYAEQVLNDGRPDVSVPLHGSMDTYTLAHLYVEAKSHGVGDSTVDAFIRDRGMSPDTVQPILDALAGDQPDLAGLEQDFGGLDHNPDWTYDQGEPSIFMGHNIADSDFELETSIEDDGF